MNSSPQCFVEVNLRRLRKNFREIKRHTDSLIVPVVKSNAYGLGLVEISKALSEEGVSTFAVGNLDEALLLKKYISDISIFIINPIITKEVKLAVKENIIFPVYDPSFAKEALRYSTRKRVPVHIEIDTGIGRAGVPYSKAGRILSEFLSLKGLKIEGVFSHFANAEEDTGFTQEQMAKFLRVLQPFLDETPPFPLIHIANSAGFISLKETHSLPFNASRIGLLLYGYTPSPIKRHISLNLSPVVEMKSRVIRIFNIRRGMTVGYGCTYRAPKRMRLATIGTGYAWGYPRSLSNKGEVLIKGKRARVLGRVSMDLTVVDITHISNVKVGDKAVLLGKQGKETITMEKWVDSTSSIPYVILTDFGKLTKKYKN